MKFTTKTEYGLVCLVYMARHPAQITTVKEIASQESFSLTYLQQIFHVLCDAGIVKSHHGRQGGYELARPAGQITLKEIVEALEGATFEVFCEPEVRKDIVCTHFSLCGMKHLWSKTKDLLDQFFNSVTLETLSQGEGEVKHHFSISAKAAG